MISKERIVKLNIAKAALVIILASTSAAWAQQYPDAGASQGKDCNGLRLQLATLKPSYQANDPVILSVITVNNRSREYQQHRRIPIQSLIIDLFDDKGNAVPMTLYGKELFAEQKSVDKDANLSLGTSIPGNGGTERFQFWLNRLFDISRSGSYFIRVSRSMLSLDSQKFILRSNECKFTVTDPDVSPYSLVGIVDFTGSATPAPFVGTTQHF